MPRTNVGGISLPRILCGTNWFLGYSHQTNSKDRTIKEFMDEKRVTDILCTCVKNGIDAVMGPPSEFLVECIKKAEEKTGVEIIYICTPWKIEEVGWAKEKGAKICMPHTSVTDTYVNKRDKNLNGIEVWLRKIREYGMIPGLSTHVPETVIYADITGLDVETYMQIYNALGFLCQIEVEWIYKIINEAKKPVMIIKPFAAGRLTPFVGLNFVVNTIRDIDMITIGFTSPYEVEEDVEIFLSIIERRKPNIEYQITRSKK
ncbi:MAG: hypothetical protein NZ891_03680, partial [bacterium]|nr:hypothetical protein [bacterium]MDW8163825.1 hypothetical protein [Candidatus Omnitrophota bacterium]